MKVIKATAAQAKAIKAQKAVVVRSAEGRMAPAKSQQSVGKLMTAKFATSKH